MVRTQVYFTDKEKKSLQRISVLTGKTQSELIREAIDQFIEEFQQDDWKAGLSQAEGLWNNRTDLPDFEAIRDEFDRVL